MTSSLTLALHTARSGLLTNQSALDAVANNVANVNTAGYSRKIVNLEARVLTGSGQGVQIGSVSRTIDEGLLKSLRLELGDLGMLDSQVDYFQRLQELFGSPADNVSISHYINEFGNALESLALSPDKSLEQSEVVRWAEEIALSLQQASETIQELRAQADKEIADHVTRINELLANIEDLNNKIVRNAATNIDVSDLRDKRDMALDELSGLIDISYFYRGDGDVVVFTRGGRTLVENTAETLTHVAASSMTPTLTHAEGDIGGIFVGDTSLSSNDITDEITSGELKGLIELRDQVLTDMQAQLDELAAELRDTVNQIHNRGVGFPGLQEMTGTRTFIAPTTQTMTLDAAGGVDDVTIALFDASGDQQATTTLETIMTSAGFGSGAQAANGPWTISEVAATVEDWLQANGAGTATVQVNASGKFEIVLNNSNLYLSFRDETATASGSTQSDAAISFDANGDGVNDETINGFSYFLGLNDFFVDGLADNVSESNVLSSSFSASAATLTFTDSTGALGSVAVNAGDDLATIVAAVNQAGIGVTASLVPDGTGQRLRFSHDGGIDMTVTQAAGNTLLSELGMHSADVRTSSQITVRSDLVTDPSRVSRGAVQWDAGKGTAGEYYLSLGDDTVVQTMASALASSNTFDAAGGISARGSTFEQYAATIISQNSSLAETNESRVEYHQALADSLQTKSDSVRGVNLDEEMSQLIVYEQAYNASARVISVINDMFEALENVV